jgi:hypothetical protein
LKGPAKDTHLAEMIGAAEGIDTLIGRRRQMNPPKGRKPLSFFPSQFGVAGVAQGLDLVSQAEDAFARNADVTENRGAQAGGPILEGLAVRSYPVLRM